MLFLNKEAILQSITTRDAIDAIDTAYNIYEMNNASMPIRTQIQDDDNTLLLMPCITNDTFATKLITVFPKNRSLPSVQGLIVLHDNENGNVKAIMDGTFITGFRTGAIGGSATRHLAAPAANTLAIIGTGTQGLYQAVAACSERPITDIYLYNRTIEKIPSFQENLKKWIGNHIRLHPVRSAAEAIADAKIVITATTSSTPVLPGDKTLLKNRLIIGIGSFQPTMREFPDALYDISSDILVDSADASEESGDIKTPLNKGWINDAKIQTMSTYLSDNYDIPKDDGKSILFKSTGMALFDATVANLIYLRAVEKGVGNQMTMR